MSEFTRGPWVVMARSPNPHWRGDGTEIFSESYGRVAETYVSGLRDPEECRANALLIAAAPGMLDVLRRVAEHFADTDAPLGKAAVAAINKAILPQPYSSTTETP